MDNFSIELYLAKMDNKDWSEWKISRNGVLKEIDKLRLFYLSQYLAKTEV